LPATLRITDEGLVEEARYVASPNCDDRPAGSAVELIVLHAISLPPGAYGGPAIEALFTNRLDCTAHPDYSTLAGLEVSAHFLIRRDGELVQFVPCGRRAWHAGVSSWKGRARCNDFSIGIELEGTDHDPFEDAQYATLARLTRALKARYPVVDIAGHSDVAPGRKTDPGPRFDWARYRALLETETRERGVDIRRAVLADYPGILQLQAANYLGILTAAERSSGFLSAQFTPEQVAAMAADLGIIVASDDDRIVGYLCAHRADLAPVPPLIEAMFACAWTVVYRGNALAGARVFTYGPVCIDRAYRGRGLLRDHDAQTQAEVLGGNILRVLGQG
jgi:AmpD protein